MKPLDTIRITLRTTAERIKENPSLLIVYSCFCVGVIYAALETYRLFIYPITK